MRFSPTGRIEGRGNFKPLQERGWLVTATGYLRGSADIRLMQFSTPVKVLQVTARFFPYVGGTETHVYEVSRWLVRAGVGVTVLTTDTSGELPPEDELDGIKIKRVPAYPQHKDFYYSPGISREIETGMWDLVHSQGIHTFVPVLAMAAARRSGRPYLVTFHAGGHSSRLRNSLRGLQWRLVRPLLIQADRLVGVSRYEVDMFRRILSLPDERFALIPNGADLPPIDYPITIDPDRPVLVSIGRLERYKGHQRVIAALPHVLEKIPGLRLLIIGSGPYKSQLSRLAGELGVTEQVEVRAIPPGERRQMAETLAVASLVVLLSERESHPIAVIEALALGRPTLVADTSGLSELAGRGWASAIPLDSTNEQVAEAILEQLRNPRLPPPIHLPTWEETTGELLRLYAEIIGERQCAY